MAHDPGFLPKPVALCKQQLRSEDSLLSEFILALAWQIWVTRAGAIFEIKSFLKNGDHEVCIRPRAFSFGAQSVPPRKLWHGQDSILLAPHSTLAWRWQVYHSAKVAPSGPKSCFGAHRSASGHVRFPSGCRASHHPESNVTRHGTVSFYSSRFEDGGPTSIKRSGSLRDRSPDRFLESASLLREMRQRDTSGFDTIGRCRSPESYVNTSTPYSTVKSGYNKSHRTHSESGDHYQLIDSARHKYSPSDPSYTPKTPKRSASLDRRPSFERNYNNSMNRDGSTWRAREGSWPRYTDTVSSKNSNTSTWKTRTHQSYNYMEGDTPERRSRRDDRSVSPVQRSGSLRRDASPIRPGYGGEDQDPRYNTYASNNTYATIERESRTRTRGGSGGGGGGGSHETHSHHHHRRDDSGSGSESRSRSPSTSRHRHGRQRDASPIMPGYGTDADPSKIVRSYNYQYMGDGSGSRSPSPNSIRRYFSQKSIEEKHRPSRSTTPLINNHHHHHQYDQRSTTRKDRYDADDAFYKMLNDILHGGERQTGMSLIERKYPADESDIQENSKTKDERRPEDEADVPMWTAEVYAFNFTKTPSPEPPAVITRTITTEEHLRQTLRTLDRVPSASRKKSTAEKSVSTVESTSNHMIEPSRHKIKYVRKEPERPPTPLGERIYPKNITNSDVGSQRPPKQVDELMASFSGQQLHEYRNVGPGLSQIRSSTPKPEKKVEIDETRIVVKHTDNNISDEQKKIVPSKAGPAVYYPPGFESTLQKREEGKAVPLWMSGEAEMSRGSYKYKSRSKSKEKKGAVAVPVCLPVCCAAPLCCSVM
ncbi:unnamed protein product [Notodromas monacha]|uniref:Uncharacterized protein n=1 Tax=Notodromas monacha TaxID=399045 RepID=A0A7R9BH53_9CRUS|nr:unnamed protein product [Notodromas monacha]CAG0914027.1 unnamed protein product [Notodromas monacha]